MTIPTWPTTLPRPDRDSWQKSPQDARLKRQNDAGPPSYRRRYSSVAQAVTLSIMVDRDGKAVFDKFRETTTSEGSLPFYMPDPTTDGWGLFTADGQPLLTNDDQPLLLAAQWLCLFGDTMPAEAVVGVEFRITFSVSVMP
ncbi:hypothetical protein HB780_05425 (plasmid) [Rhizobium lusitanum]|uniref:hypothetical protein n=1 Tax=Rhizobium lusitanum TaxID=293958 RepID=UPI001608FB83|nr:hypothetical protein [Rhizobium lusitanum]QND45197.1 hypothetical protein HB780_05425 [Rhizobium lusitanum]